MFNENDNRIILTDENGNDVTFEFLDLIEYKGDQYVVLLPLGEESTEVVILMVEEGSTPDKESYISVENEEDLLAVFQIFKDKFKEEFNFAE